MKSLSNILQHYSTYDESFIRLIYNSMENTQFNFIIKEIGFCNPAEYKIITELLPIFNISHIAQGGYSEAELKYVIFYPHDFTPELKLSLIEIKYNRKFNNLEHKHIMGTLYNQGINPRLIGDIIINSDNRCQLIITEELENILLVMLNKINNIPVKYEKIDNISITNKELFANIRSSSGLRLDSICKMITRISRNKISLDIKKGLVQVNHFIITDTKYIVQENDLISIRGFGRVKINEIIPVNKKYNIKYGSTFNL